MLVFHEALVHDNEKLKNSNKWYFRHKKNAFATKKIEVKGHVNWTNVLLSVIIEECHNEIERLISNAQTFFWPSPFEDSYIIEISCKLPFELVRYSLCPKAMSHYLVLLVVKIYLSLSWDPVIFELIYSLFSLHQIWVFFQCSYVKKWWCCSLV